MAAGSASASIGRRHLAALRATLPGLEAELGRVARWAEQLSATLGGPGTRGRSGRLLVAGNGGSAAQAQHLAVDLRRRWWPRGGTGDVVALAAETSALTAVACDRGWDDVFAAPVRAGGRPGDVLLALSTSGRSPNVVAAVEAARAAGLVTWALTGPRPNPLAEAAHDALCIEAATTATVQEAHQVVLDLLCAALDAS